MLAQAADLTVTAHHVDHGHAVHTAEAADRAAAIAAAVGVGFVLHEAQLAAGPNFEARARAARRRLLPADAMTGHTADDLAETVVLRLLRGTGPDGFAAMTPGERHPLLGLRRAETLAVCDTAGISPLDDPTNHDPAYTRNRVRHELLPLADDIAGRDVVPLLARTAQLAAADREFLDGLAQDIDPTDAKAIASAPPALAQRAIRMWLAEARGDGYPPDLAAIERVLAVARNQAASCEVGAGIRVTRSGQRLRIVAETL